MTTSSGRKHAGPGPASDQPPVPEPTFAERARTLLYLGRIGSLSTLSRKQPGFPFGSVMPYGLDDHGRPIFLISTMAMHTQNLQPDPRASLLVTQENKDGEPLGASRVTLVGNVHPVPNTELAEVRKRYLERHANSKYWVDFEDFSFYRMDVVDEHENPRDIGKSGVIQPSQRFVVPGDVGIGGQGRQRRGIHNERDYGP